VLPALRLASTTVCFFALSGGRKRALVRMLAVEPPVAAAGGWLANLRAFASADDNPDRLCDVFPLAAGAGSRLGLEEFSQSWP